MDTGVYISFLEEMMAHFSDYAHQQAHNALRWENAVLFHDNDTPHTIVNKFCGNLFEAKLGHSPFDVVAWVGNSAPYKYDLSLP